MVPGLFNICLRKSDWNATIGHRNATIWRANCRRRIPARMSLRELTVVSVNCNIINEIFPSFRKNNTQRKQCQWNRCRQYTSVPNKSMILSNANVPIVKQGAFRVILIVFVNDRVTHKSRYPFIDGIYCSHKCAFYCQQFGVLSILQKR